TFHPAPSEATGNPNCRPSGVPYSPRLATARECQSPLAVGVLMLTTESIAAFAADPADESPLISITAAPRFCTVVMKSPPSQAASLITSGAGRPPMRAFFASGYCVAEWLPQMVMFVTWETATPAFFASCVLARFSSSLVIANQRSAGTCGAFARAVRQLVLHGFPTTSTRTSD